MPEVVAYGSDPPQFLELTLPPAAGPAPVAVVLHGGFWRAAYGVELARPLAAELAAAGWAAVAVEYPPGGRGGRRVPAGRLRWRLATDLRRRRGRARCPARARPGPAGSARAGGARPLRGRTP